MLRAGAIVMSLVATPYAALGQEVVGEIRPEVFVGAVWDYVAQRCPDAVLKSEVANNYIRNTLREAASRTPDIPEGVVANYDYYLSLDRYKHSLTMPIVGAQAVVVQLGYMSQVVDGPAEGEDIISLSEIEANIALMDCIMPTPEELRTGVSQEVIDDYAVRFGGDDINFADIDEDLVTEVLWTLVANQIHQSNCEIEITKLTRRFVDADFTDLDAEERQALKDEIEATHEAYLEDKLANAPCEEFM